MTTQRDDLQVKAEARKMLELEPYWVYRAGVKYLEIPRTLLEELVDLADRPHD